MCGYLLVGILCYNNSMQYMSDFFMLFAENLKKVIIDQEIDLSRLHNNLQARRAQTRVNRERNNIILQKQKDLVEHR